MGRRLGGLRSLPDRDRAALRDRRTGAAWQAEAVTALEVAARTEIGRCTGCSTRYLEHSAANELHSRPRPADTSPCSFATAKRRADRLARLTVPTVELAGPPRWRTRHARAPVRLLFLPCPIRRIPPVRPPATPGPKARRPAGNVHATTPDRTCSASPAERRLPASRLPDATTGCRGGRRYGGVRGRLPGFRTRTTGPSRGRALVDHLVPIRRPRPCSAGSGTGRQRAEFALPGEVRPDGDDWVVVDVRASPVPGRGRLEPRVTKPAELAVDVPGACVPHPLRARRDGGSASACADTVPVEERRRSVGGRRGRRNAPFLGPADVAVGTGRRAVSTAATTGRRGVGGVGTTTLAVALRGRDGGREALGPADILACRGTVDSLARRVDASTGPGRERVRRRGYARPAAAGPRAVARSAGPARPGRRGRGAAAVRRAVADPPDPLADAVGLSRTPLSGGRARCACPTQPRCTSSLPRSSRRVGSTARRIGRATHERRADPGWERCGPGSRA